MHVDETIVAIASSHEGNGLRGIIRVSGSRAVSCVRQVFESECQPWESTRARRYPGRLHLGQRLGAVDGSLYLWPTHRSYTCQPLAEIHTYGARPLLDAVVQRLTIDSARLARPGEFTLRAFLAGRIDLAQAEAVLGVIDAANDRELNVALRQLAGGLSQPLTQLRDTLLNVCADLEAGLDFVEEDIEFVSAAHLQRELLSAQGIIDHTLRRISDRKLTTALARVVLRGAPNAGKSSLWNQLVGRDAAIVTAQAGTTRDYLTAIVDRQGIRFTLIDTAGIEQIPHPLYETIQDATERQTADADLILLCVDASRPRTPWEIQECNRLQARDHLVVATKADVRAVEADALKADVVTSSVTQAGLDELVQMVRERLDQLQVESAVVGSTAARCEEGLHRASECVHRALEVSRADAGDELIAAEIRLALDHLGQVVGTVYTDDILDRVFSRFCIGK